MFTDIQSAKDFARRLKFALREIDPSIKLHTCQGITARMCLYNGWHHLEQLIPIKPHLPDHATVVGRLRQELTLIGSSLTADDLLKKADSPPICEVIIHPNGDTFLFDAIGDDDRSKFISSFIKSVPPQIVECRLGTGQWRFKIISYNVHAPMIVGYPLDDARALRNIEDRPEIIEAALNYKSSWFDEKMISFVRLAGLDITSIRPSYTDEVAASVLSEAYAKLLHPSSHETLRPVFLAHRLAEFIATALDAITADRTLLKANALRDGRKLARCFSDGSDYRGVNGEIFTHEALTHALDEVGLSNQFAVAVSILLNIDPAKALVSDDHWMAPFHFLPSEHGEGCRPSLYGWPGSDEWKAKYSNLRGVALKPPHDPDNLALILAQKHFEECGVVFLDLPQAQEYLDRAAHKWGANVKYWRLPEGLRAPKVSVPQKITAQLKGMIRAA